jgi:hypothetical protein
MPWVQIDNSTQATWDNFECVQNALGDERPHGLLYNWRARSKGAAGSC